VFVRNVGRIVLAVTVSVAALAGCADGTADDASTSPSGATADANAPTAKSGTTLSAPSSTLPEVELPAGIDVFVEFPRYLQLQRRLEVAFDNQGDEEITVDAVALRSPLFAPVDLDEQGTRIESGRRRDLQIDLGPAVCPAPGATADIEVVAEIDGTVQHGLLEVPVEPLQQISDAECGQALVLQQVEIGLAAASSDAGGVIQTALTLRRLDGDQPVELSSLRGSVLIELTAATPAVPIATLPSGQDAVDVPVLMRVIRCDPHAVIESKKTFQLSVWLAVGDDEPQRLFITPEGELLDALQTLIDDCLQSQYD
jgi:hypothetical protein